MSTQKKAPRWKLYWATTPDHDEDWFVLARSKRAACRFHELEEGYDEAGYASAELICPVPEKLQASTHEGWPSHEFLEECGGEFVSGAPVLAMHEMLGCGQRAVKFGNRIYKEGDIVANVDAQIKKAYR